MCVVGVYGGGGGCGCNGGGGGGVCVHACVHVCVCAMGWYVCGLVHVFVPGARVQLRKRERK